MIIIRSRSFIPHKAGERHVPAPPVLPLALVSATYDPDFSSVTLTFNQDINTDAMVINSIMVVDAQFQGLVLRAFTTTGLTANSVTVEMEFVETATGSGVTMTVDAGNGIVPASGGDEWPGLSAVALPFP